MCVLCLFSFFFFQAEDGIRDTSVTGVQTCALPISPAPLALFGVGAALLLLVFIGIHNAWDTVTYVMAQQGERERSEMGAAEIGRASCRERVEGWVVGGALEDRKWRSGEEGRGWMRR